MAPSQSADSILNYIFLLFGIALISVLLQSLVRFEAIRVQTVWAVSVHLSDHDEEHVARVANEIWGTGADEATSSDKNTDATATGEAAVDSAIFKRRMSKQAHEGGLGLSIHQSKALLQHLDLKRTGSISREAFEKFYQRTKQPSGLDMDDILRRQALRRGTLCMTYVLSCAVCLSSC